MDKKMKKRFYVVIFLTSIIAFLLTCCTPADISQIRLEEIDAVQTAPGQMPSGQISVNPADTGQIHTVQTDMGQPDILQESSVRPAVEEPVRDSRLTVCFIDVGQGDSTLIICDGEAMLIDAGGDDMGTTVQLFLMKHNVENLKYVIATHPDADHIGGLDVILYKFRCETILMPDKSNDTAAYRNVIDIMKQKNYSSALPVVGDSYSLGTAAFTIVGPSQDYPDSNNCSVAVLLRHGENTFLFTGDAEAEEENDIISSGIDIDIDVYKVGHHGSSTSSGDALLEAMTPQYAVISCGKGNPYGHPHSETLDSLRSMNVQIFRTDEQGSITVVSDGENLVWDCSTTEIWQAGEQTESSQETEPSGSPAYILNTNTYRFHYPTCPSVIQIRDKNRQETNAGRDEIIGLGYKPCKECNP